MITPARRPLTVESAHARRDLSTTISGCTSCRACYNGRGPVLPVGPTPNDIMILGEAPTFVDDRRRHLTFSGDPGVMLQRLLAAAGFSLDDLFFANTISCWPDGKITDPMLRACSPNVKLAITACDPRVVIALGAHALKTVSDRKRTITADHGIPFLPVAGPAVDRWVWPTWHPAALKQNAYAEVQLRADLVAFGEWYRNMDASGWPSTGLVTP